MAGSHCIWFRELTQRVTSRNRTTFLPRCVAGLISRWFHFDSAVFWQATCIQLAWPPILRHSNSHSWIRLSERNAFKFTEIFRIFLNSKFGCFECRSEFALASCSCFCAPSSQLLNTSEILKLISERICERIRLWLRWPSSMAVGLLSLEKSLRLANSLAQSLLLLWILTLFHLFGCFYFSVYIFSVHFLTSTFL